MAIEPTKESVSARAVDASADVCPAPETSVASYKETAVCTMPPAPSAIAPKCEAGPGPTLPPPSDQKTARVAQEACDPGDEMTWFVNPVTEKRENGTVQEKRYYTPTLARLEIDPEVDADFDRWKAGLAERAAVTRLFAGGPDGVAATVGYLGAHLFTHDEGARVRAAVWGSAIGGLVAPAVTIYAGVQRTNAAVKIPEPLAAPEPIARPEKVSLSETLGNIMKILRPEEAFAGMPSFPQVSSLEPGRWEKSPGSSPRPQLPRREARGDAMPPPSSRQPTLRAVPPSDRRGGGRPQKETAPSAAQTPAQPSPVSPATPPVATAPGAGHRAIEPKQNAVILNEVLAFAERANPEQLRYKTYKNVGDLAFVDVSFKNATCEVVTAGEQVDLRAPPLQDGPGTTTFRIAVKKIPGDGGYEFSLVRKDYERALGSLTRDSTLAAKMKVTIDTLVNYLDIYYNPSGSTR